MKRAILALAIVGLSAPMAFAVAPPDDVDQPAGWERGHRTSR